MNITWTSKVGSSRINKAVVKSQNLNTETDWKMFTGMVWRTVFRRTTTHVKEIVLRGGLCGYQWLLTNSFFACRNCKAIPIWLVFVKTSNGISRKLFWFAVCCTCSDIKSRRSKVGNWKSGAVKLIGLFWEVNVGCHGEKKCVC